jgi:hypothetical protein
MTLPASDPGLATQIALHAYAIECNHLLRQIEDKARPLLDTRARSDVALAVHLSAEHSGRRLAAVIREALQLTTLLRDADRVLDTLSQDGALGTAEGERPQH